MSVRTIRGTLATPGVRSGLSSLLAGTKLCAVASVAPDGGAHINTAYFAVSADLAFYFFSYPTSRHARFVRRNPRTAVAIYDSRQVWGRPDRGVQLFGTTRQLSGEAAKRAARVYARRFRGFRGWVRSASAAEGAFRLVPFGFTPRALTLFDERRFGSGVFVNVRIPRRKRRASSPRRRARS
ncbi:MAG: pyridoxamine 5'-phosphate oxidase family protein [Thermoplasmata archaeon]|nr:pyridoxamine 5'-phosphate oxidase family protein [Thermoplasmata archaeon]